MEERGIMKFFSCYFSSPLVREDRGEGHHEVFFLLLLLAPCGRG